MKLRTRLTVLSALVITILSFGISATALLSAERSEIARLDSVLNGIVDGAAVKDDVVSAAMRRADESPINVAVAFVTYEDDVTMLSKSKLKLDPVPTLEQRRDARRALRPGRGGSQATGGRRHTNIHRLPVQLCHCRCLSFF